MQLLNAAVSASNFKGSSEGKLASSYISDDLELYANSNNPNFGKKLNLMENPCEIKKIANLPPEFAFICHKKNTQTTYFAIDCFATKPLFYAFDGTELLINNDLSSLVKQLNHVTVDNNKIFTYFKWETDEALISNATFYTEIKRLLPAQVGVFKDGILTIQNYWKFSNFDSKLTDYQYINNIKDTFFNAVKQRLTSPRIAANLSGGLDSSSVVSTISKLNKSSFTSIYFDSKTTEGNESEFVNEVLKNISANHQIAEHPLNSYELLKKVTAIIGQPDTGVLPAFIHFQVLEKAKQSNADLLFSGHGGDSIIGYGFEYLQELLHDSEWKTLREACKQYETFHKQSISDRLFKPEIKKSLKNRHFFKALNFAFIATFYFRTNLFSFFLKFNKKTKVLDYKHFENNILLEKPQTQHKEIIPFDVNNLVEGLSKTEKQYLEYNFNNLTINGNEVLSLLGNNFDIGVSFPFFDKSIIENSLKIPSRLRFGNGYTRGVIREAMDGILPSKIKNRTSKADFTVYANQCYNSLYLFFKAEFPSNHELWTYIDKNVFEQLSEIILDSTIHPNQKVRHNWLGMRIINFGLWLKEYKNNISNAK